MHSYHLRITCALPPFSEAFVVGFGVSHRNDCDELLRRPANLLLPLHTYVSYNNVKYCTIAILRKDLRERVKKELLAEQSSKAKL
jgi:hypothetical protein